MALELIPLKFDKVMQSKAYTCVVLGTDQKKFAIYTDAQSGKSMQHYITDSARVRPSTFDLMYSIFLGYEIKIRQIVITDVQDTIFFARIFLEQKMGDILHILEIDARPSDCITLSLHNKLNRVPLYCTPEVLEKAIPMVED